MHRSISLVIIATFLVCWFIASVYGGYKLTTRNSDLAYKKVLEQTISGNDSQIKKLEKEIAMLRQTQVLEDFLIMLLNEEQEKDFLKLNDYCRQYFMEHRK
jgi:hypothetical protein